MPNKKAQRNNKRKTNRTAPAGKLITEQDKQLKKLGNLIGTAKKAVQLNNRQAKHQMSELRQRVLSGESFSVSFAPARSSTPSSRAQWLGGEFGEKNLNSSSTFTFNP